MILRTIDAVFYPFCGLLVAVMIFLPLAMASQQQAQSIQEIIDNGIVAEIDRLQTLVTGPGITASIVPGERGGSAVMVLAENRLGDPNITPSAGGFIALTPRELEVVQGHRLRVSFFIETSQESEINHVNVGVFQRGIGQNGWQLREIPANRQPIIVTVTPPLCNAEYGFFGVWPVAEGELGSVHLYEIRIDRLDPIDCEAPS